MSWMGRGMIRIGGWVVATLAAVVLTWFGVHGVLRPATPDPPTALPAATTTPSTTPTPTTAPATPTSSPVTSTQPDPPDPHTTPTAPQTASVAPIASTSPAPPPTLAPAATSAGDVHSYRVNGGEVVVTMTNTSAHLVSATPDPGWQVQTWSADGWLRVDFTQGNTTTSFFVTWNGHPPMVQVANN